MLDIMHNPCNKLVFHVERIITTGCGRVAGFASNEA